MGAFLLGVLIGVDVMRCMDDNTTLDGAKSRVNEPVGLDSS